ncbi:hypothetical protein CcaverHIS002_0700490 [Cutaneotrichosporon cavernicola]|nr:hypothetical protein CcaverHIS002_0700490 [Cutaneotrichosporon cavernicola]
MTYSSTTSEWSHVDEDDLASSDNLSGIECLDDLSPTGSDADLHPLHAANSGEAAGPDTSSFQTDAAEKDVALRAATDALARLQSENHSLRATLRLRTLERDLPASAAILKSARDVQLLMDDLLAKTSMLSMVRGTSYAPSAVGWPGPMTERSQADPQHSDTTLWLQQPPDIPASPSLPIAAHLSPPALPTSRLQPETKEELAERNDESLYKSTTKSDAENNDRNLKDDHNSGIILTEPTQDNPDPILAFTTYAESNRPPPGISRNQLKKREKRARYEARKIEKAAARAAQAAAEGNSVPTGNLASTSSTVSWGKSASDSTKGNVDWLAVVRNASSGERREAAETIGLMHEQASGLLQVLLDRHKVLAQMTLEELQLQEKGFYRLSQNEMEIMAQYPEVVTIDGETFFISSPLPEGAAPATASGSQAVDLASFWQARNRELDHGLYAGSDASTEIGIEYVEEYVEDDGDDDVLNGESDDE